MRPLEKNLSSDLHHLFSVIRHRSSAICPLSRYRRGLAVGKDMPIGIQGRFYPKWDGKVILSMADIKPRENRDGMRREYI